jgi:hypothetical protein
MGLVCMLERITLATAVSTIPIEIAMISVRR